jgi:phosphatidylinositol kinase/protein kinase (PI-3  family)
LRQEQFATQLINEFHQIFKLEGVKCWVNTYEIVATGNNVGIIECVPNAISIDQLKRKIGVNSLRTFFENYFGPTSSSSNII